MTRTDVLLTVFMAIGVAGTPAHGVDASATGGAPPQVQPFRPSNLGDLVKAVGVSQVGLEEVDLTRQVADHALHIGAQVGIAARFRDDPQGPLFIGWRAPGQSWTYAFLGERDFGRAVPDPSNSVRLGYVKALAPVGDLLALETEAPASHPSSAVLRRDLTPVFHLPGAVKLALPGDRLVFERLTTSTGGGRVEDLAIVEIASRRVTPLFAARTAEGESVAIGFPSFDQATDGLAFSVTVTSPSDAATPSRTHLTVTCRPMRDPAPACVASR